MEFEIHTLEALAHYTRGGVTIFFIFWNILLRRYRKRSRMMRLLYVTSLLISVCYVKDVLFTFEAIKYSDYLNSLSGIVDIVYVPVLAAFFLETVRPGVVSNRQMAAAILVQASFVPVYILWPTEGVELLASLVSYSISAATVVCVTIFAVRYRKLMFANYSYTDNIDVVWVLISCYAYFITHVLYSLSFNDTTWLSEILFNVTGMIIWTVMFKLAQRHKVLKMFLASDDTTEDTLPDMNGEQAFNDNTVQEEYNMFEKDDENENEMAMNERDRVIASRLRRVMVEEEMYLLPKLSIVDLAVQLGTNKTYLSDYLNNRLNVTFHDYVNKYRIERACYIIDNLPADSRRTILDLSTSCGFNSITSFNRHFVKIKGISPKEYLVNHFEKIESSC